MKIILGIASIAAVVTAITIVQNKHRKPAPWIIIAKKLQQLFKPHRKKNTPVKKPEKPPKTTIEDTVEIQLEYVPNKYKSFCCELCQVLQYVFALDNLYNNGKSLTDDQYKMIVEYEIIQKLGRIKKKFDFINDFDDKKKYKPENVDFANLIKGLNTSRIVERLETLNYKNPNEIKTIANTAGNLLKNCGLFPLYINDEEVNSIMKTYYNIANAYYIEVPAIFYNNSIELQIFDVCIGLTKEES